MPKQYKTIQWISAHRDARIITIFARPGARMFNDPVLRDLNMRVLGAYLNAGGDLWEVDLKFGKGEEVFSGVLFIDKPTKKIFVRLNDFLGAQPEIFLE